MSNQNQYVSSSDRMSYKQGDRSDIECCFGKEASTKNCSKEKSTDMEVATFKSTVPEVNSNRDTENAQGMAEIDMLDQQLKMLENKANQIEWSTKIDAQYAKLLEEQGSKEKVSGTQGLDATSPHGSPSPIMPGMEFHSPNDDTDLVYGSDFKDDVPMSARSTNSTASFASNTTGGLFLTRVKGSARKKIKTKYGSDGLSGSPSKTSSNTSSPEKSIKQPDFEFENENPEELEYDFENPDGLVERRFPSSARSSESKGSTRSRNQNKGTANRNFLKENKVAVKVGVECIVEFIALASNFNVCYRRGV